MATLQKRVIAGVDTRNHVAGPENAETTVPMASAAPRVGDAAAGNFASLRAWLLLLVER